MSIQIKNLTKIYGQQRAVDDISFSIAKGEIVGFLGPNGAGKSTTMKMLTGYIQPDGGTASICNIDVAKNPLVAKRYIGYLPEANPLYTDMYVKEYLQWVAKIYSIQHSTSNIQHIVELTGLGSEYSKKIHQLSKGYKQRVGLAAALLHNPEVLILDEPTSGLDPNQIIEIRLLIKQMGKAKTVLFSSHILQEIESICDRVIIIHKGKIVADNTLQALQNTHQQKKQIKVQYKESVTLEMLQQLPAITHIQQSTEGAWIFEGEKMDVLQNAILNHALQNCLNIISLQHNTNSLEGIFRALTG